MWNVTFQLYDNINVVYHVINGHTTSIPSADRTGYHFIRWVANNSTWNTSSEITDHIVITAEYEKYIFNITIDANGGSNSSNTTMEYGSILTEPLTSRSYYDFDYWINTSTNMQLSFPVTITGDLNIQAHWTPISYSISYTMNDAEQPTYTTYTIETPTFTIPSVSKSYYTFSGWSGTDISNYPKTITITKGSTGDREYTANWTPITYTISYNLNDGTNNSNNRTSYTIETATFTVYTATRSNYYFDGWTGTGLSSVTTSFNITKGSTGDRVYTANWTILRTVTYNSNGSIYTTQKVRSGNTTSSPGSPAPTGYTFSYWYLDNENQAFNFSTAITSDITLTAKHVVRRLTINYDYTKRQPGYYNEITTTKTASIDYGSELQSAIGKVESHCTGGGEESYSSSYCYWMDSNFNKYYDTTQIYNDLNIRLCHYFVLYPWYYYDQANTGRYYDYCYTYPILRYALFGNFLMTSEPRDMYDTIFFHSNGSEGASFTILINEEYYYWRYCFITNIQFRIIAASNSPASHSMDYIIYQWKDSNNGFTSCGMSGNSGNISAGKYKDMNINFPTGIANGFSISLSRSNIASLCIQKYVDGTWCPNTLRVQLVAVY